MSFFSVAEKRGAIQRGAERHLFAECSEKPIHSSLCLPSGYPYGFPYKILASGVRHPRERVFSDIPRTSQNQPFLFHYYIFTLCHIHIRHRITGITIILAENRISHRGIDPFPTSKAERRADILPTGRAMLLALPKTIRHNTHRTQQTKSLGQRVEDRNILRRGMPERNFSEGCARINRTRNSSRVRVIFSL